MFMKRKKQNIPDRPEFVESSLGIVTTTGNWFHTTSEQIKNYAPGLFKYHSLDELVRAAETWIKSADSLALIIYMGLGYLINPWLAALLVIAFHIFWYWSKSAFVTPSLTKIFKWLNTDAFLYIVSGIALSFFGIKGMYAELWVGILLFFIFKLGLLRWGLNKLERNMSKSISLNDRLLKMIIVKYALQNDITIPEIEKMDQNIKEIIYKKYKK